MRYVLTLTAALALVACSDDGDKPLPDMGTDGPVSPDLPWQVPDMGEVDGPLLFDDQGLPPDQSIFDQGPSPDVLDDMGTPADAGPPPNNNTCGARTTLTWQGSKITMQVDTTNATDDIDLGSSSCTGDYTSGNDVFFEITLPAGAFDIVLTPTGSLDPALYLLSSCAISSCIAGTDIVNPGTAEKLTVNPTGSTTYIIGVDAWDPSEAGVYSLEIDVAAAVPDGGLPDVGPTPDITVPDSGPPVDVGPTPDLPPAPDVGPLPDGAPVGKVVITEIMADPATPPGDTKGEWIEVYNPGTAAVDLKDWTLKDQGSDSHTITANVVVAPGAYVVLARNGTPADNGGITPAYVYSGFFLGNSGDEIELYDPQNNLVDQVVFTGAWFTQGFSLSLLNPALDNSVQSNWCNETASYGTTTNKGSPGVATTVTSCP